MLATFACAPGGTKGRLHLERPTPYRNEFQRDRDRIVHSNAFRRLQYKTQVFINHEGDHYRNRLTHSIEVASVARSLCTALNISEDLAECISLCHDIGHTPFGHTGERALNECMEPYGGFCHNAHSIKLMTQLEQRYVAYDGINLSWEVLEGTAKHNGPILSDIPVSIAEYNKIMDLDLGRYSSLESQISSASDDIAYCCHDIEDAVRANIFEIHELEEVPLLQDIVVKISTKYHRLHKHRKIYEIVRELSHVLIDDLLANTQHNIRKHSIVTQEDIRNAPEAIGIFSQNILKKISELKMFLSKYVYHHHELMKIRYKCYKIVQVLFDIYFHYPHCMKYNWQPGQMEDDYLKARAVSDYIAGMTDRYAIKEYNNIQHF